MTNFQHRQVSSEHHPSRQAWCPSFLAAFSVRGEVNLSWSSTLFHALLLRLVRGGNCLCCAEAIEDTGASAERVVELENALYQSVYQEGAEEEGVLADRSNAQRFKMQRLGGGMKFAQNALFEPRAMVEAVDVTSAPQVVTPISKPRLQGEHVTGFHRLSKPETQTIDTEERLV